jgi:hypothetical protein
MGLVIGMDEAGYGPNLGPLVVTVTAWEVPGAPANFDFWGSLSHVVSQTAPAGEDEHRLHVADSKVVYSPARGLGPLEESVLSLLRCRDIDPPALADLWTRLTARTRGDDACEPWFDAAGLSLPLPLAADRTRIAQCSETLREALAGCGVALRAARSDIVLTERFNSLTRELNSKGAALSHISLRLLRSVWEPDGDEPVLIVADKHGGRNGYQAFITEVIDGRMVLCIREERERSGYRVRGAELRFEARAERYFPVAVASMVSKYLRELAMEAFNRFWQHHVPGVTPTKGYPADAKRFRREIAAVQQRLKIPDSVLWRER